MSIRAYKVITKELADRPTFNISHNRWIADCLCSDSELNGESGQLELERVKIGGKIEELKNIANPELYYLDTFTGKTNLKKETATDFSISIDEAIEVLTDILADFDEDEDFITYECY